MLSDFSGSRTLSTIFLLQKASNQDSSKVYSYIHTPPLFFPVCFVFFFFLTSKAVSGATSVIKVKLDAKLEKFEEDFVAHLIPLSLLSTRKSGRRW